MQFEFMIDARRFWPNNKSRMYVLENTGEFIRRHGLKCGDYIAIYQDMSKQLVRSIDFDAYMHMWIR